MSDSDHNGGEIWTEKTIQNGRAGIYDVKEDEEVYRFITDWYLTRVNSPLHRRCPLPSPSDLLCQQQHLKDKYVLYGQLLARSPGASDVPFRLENFEVWGIDRSHRLRGVWVQSKEAWYMLQKPKNDKPQFRVKVVSGECECLGETESELQQEEPLVASLPDQGIVHLELRAKFALVSNLTDVFLFDEREPESHALMKKHSKKSASQVYDSLKPTEGILARYPGRAKEPFDLRLLKRYPDFVKDHMRGFYYDFNDACPFMNSLKNPSKTTFTDSDFEKSALAAETRGARNQWGELCQGEERIDPNWVLAARLEDAAKKRKSRKEEEIPRKRHQSGNARAIRELPNVATTERCSLRQGQSETSGRFPLKYGQTTEECPPPAKDGECEDRERSPQGRGGTFDKIMCALEEGQTAEACSPQAKDGENEERQVHRERSPQGRGGTFDKIMCALEDRQRAEESSPTAKDDDNEKPQGGRSSQDRGGNSDTKFEDRQTPERCPPQSKDGETLERHISGEKIPQSTGTSPDSKIYSCKRMEESLQEIREFVEPKSAFPLSGSLADVRDACLTLSSQESIDTIMAQIKQNRIRTWEKKLLLVLVLSRTCALAEEQTVRQFGRRLMQGKKNVCAAGIIFEIWKDAAILGTQTIDQENSVALILFDYLLAVVTFMLVMAKSSLNKDEKMPGRLKDKREIDWDKGLHQISAICCKAIDRQRTALQDAISSAYEIVQAVDTQRDVEVATDSAQPRKNQPVTKNSAEKRDLEAERKKLASERRREKLSQSLIARASNSKPSTLLSAPDKMAAAGSAQSWAPLTSSWSSNGVGTGASQAPLAARNPAAIERSLQESSRKSYEDADNSHNDATNSERGKYYSNSAMGSTASKGKSRDPRLANAEPPPPSSYFGRKDACTGTNTGSGPTGVYSMKTTPLGTPAPGWTSRNSNDFNEEKDSVQVSGGRERVDFDGVSGDDSKVSKSWGPSTSRASRQAKLPGSSELEGGNVSIFDPVIATQSLIDPSTRRPRNGLSDRSSAPAATDFLSGDHHGEQHTQAWKNSASTHGHDPAAMSRADNRAGAQEMRTVGRDRDNADASGERLRGRHMTLPAWMTRGKTPAQIQAMTETETESTRFESVAQVGTSMKRGRHMTLPAWMTRGKTQAEIAAMIEESPA